MPILDDRHFEFFSHSPGQTRRVGIHLGSYLQPGDVVCLEGDLGTGKTTLVQGAAQGWGALDPVSSPTYIIVNEYRRADAQRMFHLDAYRLVSNNEVDFLDFDRMLSQGPLLIEWPERIQTALPEKYLWIHLKHTGVEHRAMMFEPKGSRFIKMVDKLRRKLYGDF
jgi:tRNA threonylcarbamoyladenosine biosynthesis protein TsaE